MLIDEIETQDIQYLCEKSAIDFNAMDGSCIVVTGATGMIGHEIILTLLSYKKFKKSPKIIAVVRNYEKAKKIFGIDDHRLQYVVTDITEQFDIKDDVDFIIHCASSTSSKDFVHSPVEVSKILLLGTMNMLELAKRKHVKSFVYLSSMEVYGHPCTDDPIFEDSSCNIDTMSVRSSYSEGKRMCESLCCSYYAEFGVPVVIACLTQTIGPGVDYNDQRVFAEFGRCVIENKNIVLHTAGNTKRNYIYLADAISAIFTVLCKGVRGEKYNVANAETYCSIKEMAVIVANKCARGKIKVIIDANKVEEYGYAPELHMNLNVSKLEKLGWKPNVDLYHMYKRLILSMNNSLDK